MNAALILARSVVSAALCTVLLTSCGQRGPLYLPGEETTQVQQPAPPAPMPAPTPPPESADTPPDAGADSSSDPDPDADKDPDPRESSVPTSDVAE